jgi:drug/metabolite transporter (DMT)-like permease
VTDHSATSRLVLPSSPPARFIIGMLAGLAAALLWGGGSVVSRHLVSQKLDPMDLALLRYIGCFPIALVALLLFRERVRLDVSWFRLIVLLLLAGPPYHVFVIGGYAHATAGAGALIITGLMQVFSLAVPFLLVGTRPGFAPVIGAGLAILGLAVFSTDMAAGFSFSALGLAIFSIAALGWALLTYYVKLWKIDPLQLTNALALWSPLFLPLYLWFRPSPDFSGPLSETLLQLIYHGMLVAYGATLLFFVAVRQVGISTAAVIQALAPGLAAFMGALLLSEILSPTRLLGIAIVIAGIVVTSVGANICAYLSHRRSQIPAERADLGQASRLR